MSGPLRVIVPVTASRRALAQRLRDEGMDVTEVEFIAIGPSSTPEAFARAVVRWCDGGYEWMAVTSRNAVAHAERVAREHGAALSNATGAIAAVGDAVVAECERVGLEVAVVPTRANAAGLVADFPAGSGMVLAPIGNLASDTLAVGLAAKGWTVDQVEAYRTVSGPGMDDAMVDAVHNGEFDVVVLTSGSVAQRFAARCRSSMLPVRCVAIGRTTARVALDAGLTVDAISPQPTYDALVDTIATLRESS